MTLQELHQGLLTELQKLRNSRERPFTMKLGAKSTKTTKTSKDKLLEEARAAMALINEEDK